MLHFLLGLCVIYINVTFSRGSSYHRCFWFFRYATFNSNKLCRRDKKTKQNRIHWPKASHHNLCVKNKNKYSFLVLRIALPDTFKHTFTHTHTHSHKYKTCNACHNLFKFYYKVEPITTISWDLGGGAFPYRIKPTSQIGYPRYLTNRRSGCILGNQFQPCEWRYLALAMTSLL